MREKKQKNMKTKRDFCKCLGSADHLKIGGSAFARSTHMLTDPDPDPATKVNTNPSDLPP